jgi:formylglycine-generating enzyme required for sulfatase activity
MNRNPLQHTRVAAIAIVALGAASANVRPDQTETDSPPPGYEGMILVPAGEFLFGSDAQEKFAESDELPQRVVQLPDFYIDQFEVSNIEYKRFIDDTRYPPPPSWSDGKYAEDADFYPVFEVSWWDAMAYARWAGKRLPTEAEWEKAARGGDGRRFPWGNEFDESLANAGDGYAPVTAYLEGASPFGVVNMCGNVAEWTASPYEPYPDLVAVLPTDFGGVDTTSAAARERLDRMQSDDPARYSGQRPREGDPRLEFMSEYELKDERLRVYRGGSINNYTRFLRCANREKSGPGSRWYNIGFRCAKDAPNAAAESGALKEPR